MTTLTRIKNPIDMPVEVIVTSFDVEVARQRLDVNDVIECKFIITRDFQIAFLPITK